jgi:hypothetical protein
VWRVEFSISSQLKNMVKESDGSLMPIDIMTFRTYDDILNIFMTLADRYFDFRYVEHKPDGKLQRKDRCRRKQLFDITTDQRAFKPVDLPTTKIEWDRSLVSVIKCLANLAADEAVDVHDIDHIRRTAQVIVNNFAVSEEWREHLNKLMYWEFMPSVQRELFTDEQSES